MGAENCTGFVRTEYEGLNVAAGGVSVCHWVLKEKLNCASLVEFMKCSRPFLKCVCVCVCVCSKRLVLK